MPFLYMLNSIFENILSTLQYSMPTKGRSSDLPSTFAAYTTELLPQHWPQLRQSSSILLSFSLCLLLISCKSSIIVARSTGNETDRLALLAFKEKITDDQLNIMSSWNDSAHFCYWQGVSCSKRHPGRVTVLNLEGKKLGGSLPPHVGNLSFLSGINLSENHFQGEIPQEMGRLSRLRYLDLRFNAFEGQIPSSLSNCSNLKVIDFNYNKFTGEIPFELSFLVRKNPFAFYFSKNYLTGGIPIWLGNATSLIALDLGDNSFQGTIPNELGRLSKLKFLNVGANNISGSVPSPIYNLSSLQYLDVTGNQLHARIPSDVGSTLFNQIGLYLGGNHFTGSLPISLSNASALVDLSFSVNNFKGTVPLNLGSLSNLRKLLLSGNNLENDEGGELNFLTSLTNCSKLHLLDIGNNMFRGKLPTSVANLSDALTMLSAGSNQIFGTIPEGIETLVGLQYLVIFNNMITGKIPAGIGNLEQLKYIYLSENRISGAIPSSLGNTTQLQRLFLQENYLEGNIPPSLGNCQQLQLLHLGGNKLTGIIPTEIASLPSITQTFNLSQNFLTGVLPPEIGNMSKLLALDISRNMLSGEIPSSVGGCEMLEQLYLSSNSFQGSIPSTLSNLKSINAIDLSKNNLSGQIPPYFQDFTLLKLLNLSHNNFEGEVPKEGIFKNQNEFSIIGNGKLCGGLKILGFPTCQVDVPKRKKVSLVLKIVIPIGISCSISLASFYLYFMRRGKTRSKSSSKDLLDEQFPKVSYAELFQATNEFSSSNLIGRGGHGLVYRGILGNGEMTVAVKVLNLTQKGADKSFVAECNALRNIRHRNLVKIITACSSIDFKGADCKALVFEFMPNGSLEEWLHYSENPQFSRENLSLTQRLSIASDIACAVEYLHHHCEIPIVHGNLKPSNILLNHEMTAHVGDFGLARVLSNYRNANSSGNSMSSIGLKGTLGYVAPESGMGGVLSLEGDMYSFGIMLLEIFTGKRPTDDIFKNGMDLHQHVKMALPGSVLEIVEPSILSDTKDNGNASNHTETSAIEVEKVVECIITALRIGVFCSMESPEERMNIKDVAAEMNKIKDKYVRTWNHN